MSVWLFAHLAGIVLWLGSGVAALLTIWRTGPEEGSARLALYRLIGGLFTTLVAPGAALTVVSGLALTMRLARTGSDVGSLGLIAMQGSGLGGALLVLGLGLPTASQLGRAAALADPQAPPPGLQRLVRRLELVSLAASGLGLIALVAAAL